MLLDTRILCILYNSHITFFGHRNRSSIAWVHQKPSAFSFEPLISFSVLSKSSEGRTCKNRLTPLDNRQDNNKIYYPLTHINTHFNSYHVWFRTKEKMQAFSFYSILYLDISKHVCKSWNISWIYWSKWFVFLYLSVMRNSFIILIKKLPIPVFVFHNLQNCFSYPRKFL